MAKDGLVCIFFFVLFFPLIFWNFLYVQPILASQPQNQNREKKKKKILAVKKQGKIQTVRVETRKVQNILCLECMPNT